MGASPLSSVLVMGLSGVETEDVPLFLASLAAFGVVGRETDLKEDSMAALSARLRASRLIPLSVPESTPDSVRSGAPEGPAVDESDDESDETGEAGRDGVGVVSSLGVATFRCLAAGAPVGEIIFSDESCICSTSVSREISSHEWPV